MNFNSKLEKSVMKTNNYLESVITLKDSFEGTIYKAMKYSIDAGGKRLRPVLSLAVCELLSGDEQEVLPFACAIEMIHTYSLIHDDLPAMDDDDFRRGKLTNHKVFGEAIAILAGDALLNYSFESMLEYTIKNPSNLQAKLRAMELISVSSGTKGMIGGQVVDMEAENKTVDLSLLEYMHKCKTGALIKAAVLTSGILCNANDEQMTKLCIFAEKIGLAFQIKDDILDVEGNQEILGKPIGSDSYNNKSTFVSIYGLNEAKELLNKITEEAILAISFFEEKSSFLVELSKYLVSREN